MSEDIYLHDHNMVEVTNPDRSIGHAVRHPLPGRPHAFRHVWKTHVWYFELGRDPAGEPVIIDVTEEVEAEAVERLMAERARRRDAACGTGLAAVEPALRLVVDNGVAVALSGDDRGTPERARHDPVCEVTTTVPGRNRALAAKAQDTLDRLEANGSIGTAEFAAGRRFQGVFARAALVELRATPHLPMPGGSHGTASLRDSVIDARAELGAAMAALGGMASPVGSAAWCILGEGMSIKDWAHSRGFRLNQQVAAGLLIGALALLKTFYGGRLRGARRGGAEDGT